MPVQNIELRDISNVNASGVADKTKWALHAIVDWFRKITRILKMLIPVDPT